MSLAEQYRQQAAECIDQSQQSIDLRSKALLLQLAQAWIDLAGQVGQSPRDEILSREPLTRLN